MVTVKIEISTLRGIVLRYELTGMLHPGETVVYNFDEPPSTKKPLFSTTYGLSLFLGSFFVIALIGAFVFISAQGNTWSTMLPKLISAFLWLVGICVFIVIAYQRIAKRLKLTSIVITEKRLFMAPPADYVRDVGWEGPDEIADIIFADQLSAKKGLFCGSPCLIFTSINSFYKKVAGENIVLSNRYIPCPKVDEIYDSLPVFLKMPEMQFERNPGETSLTCYTRAVQFLADRKTKLGQN